MVRNAASELRRIREAFIIPEAKYGSKCKKCSMLEYCMPKVKKSASEYCGKIEIGSGGGRMHMKRAFKYNLYSYTWQLYTRA